SSITMPSSFWSVVGSSTTETRNPAASRSERAVGLVLSGHVGDGRHGLVYEAEPVVERGDEAVGGGAEVETRLGLGDSRSRRRSAGSGLQPHRLTRRSRPMS